MIIWKDETLYGKSHSDPLQLQEKRYKECTNKKNQVVTLSRCKLIIVVSQG